CARDVRGCDIVRFDRDHLSGSAGVRARADAARFADALAAQHAVADRNQRIDHAFARDQRETQTERQRAALDRRRHSAVSPLQLQPAVEAMDAHAPILDRFYPFATRRSSIRSIVGGQFSRTGVPVTPTPGVTNNLPNGVSYSPSM